jgi:hypothetical protein
MPNLIKFNGQKSPPMTMGARARPTQVRKVLYPCATSSLESALSNSNPTEARAPKFCCEIIDAQLWRHPTLSFTSLSFATVSMMIG